MHSSSYMHSTRASISPRASEHGRMRIEFVCWNLWYFFRQQQRMYRRNVEWWTKEKKEVADQSAAPRQIPNTIKYNFMKNESDWLHPSTDVDPHYMDKVAAYRLPRADFVFTEGKRKNITNHLIWVVLIGEQHEKKLWKTSWDAHKQILTMNKCTMNQRKIVSACSNAHAKGNCHLSRSFVLFPSHALDTRARCECTTGRHCTASEPASKFVYYLFIYFFRPTCMVNEMHAARTATKFAHRLFFSLIWGLVA